MSFSSGFTVVIAPGAWPLVEFFHPLIQAFKERSYEAICEIPSSYPDDDSKPPTNPDTKYLREDVLLPLLGEGKDIVLLMHSYGGLYGAAAVEGLSKKERSAMGKSGGIVSLIFVAAFTTLRGNSALDAMGFDSDNLPDWIYHNKSTGLVKLIKAREMLFPDLSDEEAEPLVAALPEQPYSSFAVPLLYDPYSDPMFTNSIGYIFTEADRVIPLVAQEMYAKTASASANIMLAGSPHSPHVERPAELADTTIDLVKKIEQNH